MPSAFTYELNKGTPVTLQEFVLRVARSYIGEMKEADPDAPIPEVFEPPHYHLEAVAAAQKLLAEVKKWSNTRAEAEAKKAFHKELRSHLVTQKNTNRIARSYLGMIKLVARWTPPAGREGMKRFMLEHLAEGVEHEGLHEVDAPIRLSGKKYRAQLIAYAKRDIVYHTKKHKEAVRDAAEATKAFKELRESLGVI